MRGRLLVKCLEVLNKNLMATNEAIKKLGARKEFEPIVMALNKKREEILKKINELSNYAKIIS